VTGEKVHTWVRYADATVATPCRGASRRTRAPRSPDAVSGLPTRRSRSGSQYRWRNA